MCEEKKEVYTSLAPIYDRLMAHVEYQSWYKYVKKIMKKHLLQKKPSLLEIGGGTGIVGKYFLQDSYPYLLTDLSFSMCVQAQKRIQKAICADGTALPLKKQFDCVFFLYDGINYLLTEQNYTSLFNEVHSIIHPDGLFIFDITTEANSLGYFRDYYDTEEFRDYSYTRHSYYDIDQKIQHNDFTIEYVDSSGNTRIYYEKHRQLVLDYSIIKSLIPKDKFSIVGMWDEFSFKTASSQSERIHFILKKIDAQ